MNVRIAGVQFNQFRVLFDEFSSATFYTVRYYVNGMFDEITSEMTDVTIRNVQPLDNDYLVGVAYNTPTQSEFSVNVTTSKFCS